MPANGGGAGCTPGFWKQHQYFDSWPAPFTSTTLVSDVFEDAFPGKRLAQVMLPGGGNNQLRKVGRHTVAALLNAASPDVDYDLTVAEVITMFNDVFPGTNWEYRELKDIFADSNEQGCPIDRRAWARFTPTIWPSDRVAGGLLGRGRSMYVPGDIVGDCAVGAAHFTQFSVVGV